MPYKAVSGQATWLMCHTWACGEAPEPAGGKPSSESLCGLNRSADRKCKHVTYVYMEMSKYKSLYHISWTNWKPWGILKSILVICPTLRLVKPLLKSICKLLFRPLSKAYFISQQISTLPQKETTDSKTIYKELSNLKCSKTQREPVPWVAGMTSILNQYQDELENEGIQIFRFTQPSLTLFPRGGQYWVMPRTRQPPTRPAQAPKQICAVYLQAPPNVLTRIYLLLIWLIYILTYTFSVCTFLFIHLFLKWLLMKYPSRAGYWTRVSEGWKWSRYC